jgi:hypothetical protein
MNALVVVVLKLFNNVLSLLVNRNSFLQKISTKYLLSTYNLFVLVGNTYVHNKPIQITTNLKQPH